MKVARRLSSVRARAESSMGTCCSRFHHHAVREDSSTHCGCCRTLARAAAPSVHPQLWTFASLPKPTPTPRSMVCSVGVTLLDFA
ncbi:hypothetical protein O181_001686 [Austropuccinia psidii MF-1]|uniref:Uncharacterized protein n=1 Tax=Austropuccinia psidii MF-1 TaxID=1389203 RepID=A0A9Q3BAP7_9BASI|nr:hypothetical protein [Austropuccinia psidii MF-1]